MVFIRRVRTKSGATAVQIAEYVQGRQEIVCHVGSAHDVAELGVLMDRAQELLRDPDQGVLDLGIEPEFPVAELISYPAVGVAYDPEPVEKPRVPAGRVSSTDCRVLFDAVAAIYAQLGFDTVDDAVFRDLVIARVVEPTSLLDVGRVLTDLGQHPPSYSTLQRTLRRAQEREYRDQIAAACFAHATRRGDLSLLLYDVTTLYFEAEKEDDLRKVGYSKERRVDPQIVVGLLVDRTGFPLEVNCFEGNKAEKLTIVPVIKAFQERHGAAHMVVVADAGMLSADNLKKLHDANLQFIVGSRTTKAPLDLASHFRWHGEAFTDGQIIDTITPMTRRTIENDPLKKAEPVWDPIEHPKSWRTVWAYSAKRARRDRTTLNAQETKARAVVAGEKAAHSTRFVKTSNGARSLDEASLARARRLIGLKGYVTNITAEIMPASEVIASYHDLWQVEASFRMSKTDLRARPMFVRTKDSIEAHLTIVTTALALAREAQTRTGLSIRHIVRQLRPLRSATITINATTQTLAPEIPTPQRAILDALQRPDLTH